MITLADNVIEEHARHSRAIAALLLLVAGGLGCMRGPRRA